MTVRVERDGSITTVVLSRPETRNAVDPSSAEALRRAFVAFDADDEQFVGVLWGEGGTFCSGFDLKVAASGSLGFDPQGEGPMGPTRLTLSKPVIAAVEGYAVAGGMELALWCDLRVAAEDAVFGVFSRRWGVPLIDGGTARLPRLIGEGRALDMILTGRPVDAREASAWGLVDRVVPSGTARSVAEQLAHEIAEFPQACLRADRYASITQWGMEISAALRAEAQGGELPLHSAAAGASRFVNGEGRGGAGV